MSARSKKPVGALERSLKQLTIGVQQTANRRAKGSASESAGEVQQQVQVPLSGTAVLAPIYADAGVTWRMPFLWAPQQRLAPFKVPQFSYGVEFDGPPSGLAIVHASVIGWNHDSRNWITGATIRFVAWAAAADPQASFDFDATVHLTFQGYAAQPEDTGV
jgi:hypothetical protein